MLPPQMFEPTFIQNVRLENRIVRSATWEGMCTEDGRPTGQLVDFYRELARGSVGLIITGFAYVTAEGKPLPGAMGLHDNALEREMRALTSAVHQEGGKICAQLGHAGGQTRGALCGGVPLAPSRVTAAQYRPEIPQAMTQDEVERVILAFVAAAVRARIFGFDAVQLHAAHGYLINQFLSPHTNLREDAYGGDLVGRSRFLLEIVTRVRKSAGFDFPVLVKLNAGDNLSGGLSLHEAVEVAELLDNAGIDAIEVSSGTPASGDLNPLRRGITSPEQEAYNLPAAKAVRKKVRCPLIVVGGIRSYWTARGILRRGDVNYIALSRPLIQEPDLPQRWRRGEENTLSNCHSCNGCFKTALRGSICCTGKEQREATGMGRLA